MSKKWGGTAPPTFKSGGAVAPPCPPPCPTPLHDIVLLIHSLLIPGLQIQCDRSGYVVGETVTCNCSSEIEHSTVKWRKQDLTNPEQEGDGVSSGDALAGVVAHALSSSGDYASSGDDVLSVVFLTVGPVTTDSQGEVFTCLTNSSCVAQEKTLTVDITSKCVSTVYSKTSEERTIWDRGFCPLFGGCPL